MDLSALTIPQLKQFSKDNNIRVPSKVTRKVDIIRFIEDNLPEEEKKELSVVDVTLVRDVLEVIALNADPKTLINLCKSDKRFDKLCKSKGFWKRKISPFNVEASNNATLEDYKSAYLYLYALTLSYEELEEYCKLFNVCDSVTFWREKLDRDFPDRPLYSIFTEFDNYSETQLKSVLIYDLVLKRRKDEYKYLEIQKNKIEGKSVV